VFRGIVYEREHLRHNSYLRHHVVLLLVFYVYRGLRPTEGCILSSR